VQALNASMASLTDFSEEKFQELRDRTEAYFAEYVEVEEGGWRIVLPPEQGTGSQ
jgi:hypothetical protein